MKKYGLPGSSKRRSRRVSEGKRKEMKKVRNVFAFVLVFILLLGEFPVSVRANDLEFWEPCFHCDRRFTLSLTWEDYYEEPDIKDRFAQELRDRGDILECECCTECAEVHHCAECGECSYYGGWLCPECNCCEECIDAETHCPVCKEHTDLCEDCMEIGVYKCPSCHDYHGSCPGCGTCIEALTYNGNLCTGYNDNTLHCTQCHEGWVCEDCDRCFYDYQEGFCTECGLCIDCAVAEELHCINCLVCSTYVELCEETDMCWDCCVAGGNHCPYCMEHVDEWCTGGFNTHCADCALEKDWICTGCDRCSVCDGFEFCTDCGLCADCCLRASENEGCECGLCVQSGDFADHQCDECGACDCAVDFCEICGLCVECCEGKAEDYGCGHGICAESSDWEDHYCEECGHCKDDEDCTEPCCADYEMAVCDCFAACTGDWTCSCGCQDCSFYEPTYRTSEEASHIRLQPTDRHVRVPESDLGRARDLQAFSVTTAGSDVSYR